MHLGKLLPALVIALLGFGELQAQAPRKPQQPPREAPAIRVAVNLVNVLASVLDAAGRPLADLPKESFALLEEGRAQKIEVFEAETQQPLDLALMMDTSLSTLTELRFEQDAAVKFLRQIDRQTPAELALHLIVDNYGTHKHERVRRWLRNHRRFHLHFTPTSSSWLNLVERWFAEITRKRIRRGSFHSVAELVHAIEQYVRCTNENPRPFVWTKRVDEILEKVRHCKAASVTQH